MKAIALFIFTLTLALPLSANEITCNVTSSSWFNWNKYESCEACFKEAKGCRTVCKEKMWACDAEAGNFSGGNTYPRTYRELGETEVLAARNALDRCNLFSLSSCRLTWCGETKVTVSKVKCSK